MKTLFLSLVVFVLYVGTADAQYEQTFYRDSLDATGVTTAGTHTRGFDTFRRLRVDYSQFEVKTVTVTFKKTTDSVKFQGAKVNFGTDTTWEDITFTKKKLTNLDNWTGGRLDTNVVWITPVTTGIANYTGHNPGSTGILDLTPGYKLYRMVSGKNDTGKTYLQTTLIPRR